jgi:hypothetical protein
MIAGLADPELRPRILACHTRDALKPGTPREIARQVRGTRSREPRPKRDSDERRYPYEHHVRGKGTRNAAPLRSGWLAEVEVEDEDDKEMRSRSGN